MEADKNGDKMLMFKKSSRNNKVLPVSFRHPEIAILLFPLE